ncbi:efflux RND transporter periplasmic adaptor subunit [Pseudalkalibacillus berkeleyi]|uniref:Biotin/lipoyl-binding protein n=1 Tax=Pseudalkalibacillus berkeleyi TaxID=1069813 RepID=A0ABS9GYU5_9BACL|nr:biotin/lipoyl-binding protein [Pseudalkalibacillus berkeleyi]MCF6136851.1 biotin/lipoyl-binding protein [Pseudalkalibacillus berkeleyi]
MKIHMLSLFLLLLLLSACAEEKITSDNASSNAIPVETDTVKKETFTNRIEIVGKAIPSEQVPITSSVPAEITQISVENGDTVQEGDLIMTLDDSQIRQQLNQAQSAVTALENSRNQLNNTIQEQRSTQAEINNVIDDTIKQLEEIEIPDQIEADIPIGNVNSFLKQLKQLSNSNTSITSSALPLIDSQLVQARKGVQEAKNALQATKITSPITGTINQLNASEGMPAIPGNPLAIVSSESNLNAVFPINAFQIKSIKKGMDIRLTFEEIKDPFNTTIKTITDKPNKETNTYTLTVPLKPFKKTIKSESIVTGTINIQSAPEAITVSNNALLFEGNQTYVFLVEDGRAIKQPITLKVQGNTVSQISKGLSVNDVVVTEGKYQLTNRSKISTKK